MNLWRRKRGASRQVSDQRSRQSLSFYRSQPRQLANKPPSKGLLYRAKAAVFWLSSRLSLTIALLAFLYFVIGSGTTPKVVAGSTAYRPLSDYQQVVKSHINKLKDSTKITFDSDSIVSAVSSSFPEATSVSVELPLVGRTPVVRINIAAPQFLFISNAGKTLVMTSDGKLTSGVKKEVSSQLPQIKDHSGLMLTKGDQVLSSDQINLLNQFLAQLQQAKYTVSYVDLPAAAQEVDIHLKGQPYYVKVNLGGNGAGEAGSFLATAHYLLHRHIHPQNYIDVRVSGKVFYK